MLNENNEATQRPEKVTANFSGANLLKQNKQMSFKLTSKSFIQTESLRKTTSF